MLRNYSHLNSIGILVLAMLVAVASVAALQLIPDLATGQGVAAAGVLCIGVLLLTRLRQATWLVAAVVLSVGIVLAIGGFWFSFEAWGISDWDYYFSLHETIRRTVVDYHQLPLWNPYTCGGTAALADPEFSLFTPTFVLELLFGIPRGLRAAIYLATIAGGLGVLALSKRIGLSVYAGLLAAAAYALGSVNLLEIVEGHPNIFSAAWLPWIFWCWLAAYRASSMVKGQWAAFINRWTIACGFFLALTFYQGGIYLLMYTALAFIVLPWLTGTPLRAYLVTGRAGVWALGLAALKLVPVLLWLRQFQDELYASSTYTLPHLATIFLGRHLHGAEVLPNQGSGWHEYGAYVGVVVLLLALVGVWYGRKRRLVRGLIVAAVLAVLISSTGPLLKPLFDHLSFLPRSNISRFILLAVLPLTLLAGFGLDYLRSAAPRPVRSLLTAGVVGLVGLDIMTLAYALSLQAFVLPPVVPLVAPAPPPLAFTAFTYHYRHNGDDYSRAYAAAKAGYGTLAYCSVLTPEPKIRTIHDEADNGYISTSSKQATTSVISWSPNRTVISITTPEASDVVINTNFAHGWVVNDTAAQNIVGRVATTVPAGEYILEFTYHPPGFMMGALLTLLSIAGAWLSLLWLKRLPLPDASSASLQ